MKKYVFFVLIMLLIISIYYISRSRSFQFYGEIFTKVNTSKKYVALTFDDGPTYKTDTIMKILKKNNIKATFFLTGRDIENLPNEAREIVSEGHEIGNHSYSHKRMIFKSYTFIKKEIEKTDSLIRTAGYTGDICFRPPNGKKLLFLPYYLKLNNKKTIMWNIEPESYSKIANSPEKISKYIIENSSPGSIILLHVMHDYSNIRINALDKIIHGLKEKGYEFKTVSELLKEDNNN